MVGIECDDPAFIVISSQSTPEIVHVLSRKELFFKFCKQGGKLDYSIYSQVSLLPARASEQGNVIGSVSIYIYACTKKICN